MKILILYTVLFIGLLSSCHVTRDINKKHKEEVASLQQRLEDSTALLKTYRETYERMTSEMNNTGVVFESEPCPDLNAIRELMDSAGKIQLDNILLREKIANLNNKIKVNADGSFEAEGKIKSYNKNIQKLQHEISNKDSTIEMLNRKLSEKKVEIQTVEKEKILHVKKTVFPWYFWLITGAGIFLAWFVRGKLHRRFNDVPTGLD